ncbi:DUF4254 domain-containing protein [Nocardia sp. NPDC049149]|uniref:DUF4254 domain-containing protein n=1 Tax=Nocardia sp. NPDC049149 TaxID=3364315 RepID=UPI0037135FF2
MVQPVLSFPSDDALILAIRGHRTDNHQLCQLASELGQLHWRLATDPPDTETSLERTELMLKIDVWVAVRLPVPHRTATLHTETIGSIIDRFAQAVTHAYHLLMTLDPTDERVHAAWYRVAELADGYTDLTTEVIRRARRLPAPGDRS